MMWKFLLLAVLLSADAQKLKFDQVVRDGVEITEVFDEEVPRDVFTYRLPNTTWPEQYSINLDFGDFDQSDMGFNGTVSITIRVLNSTDAITMHKHSSLVLLNSDLRTSDNVPIAHAIDDDTDDDLVREFLVVRTSTPLERDSVVRLTLNYRGSIRTSISGVYRGRYVHNRNETRCC
jgi:aminopeptidase N